MSEENSLELRVSVDVGYRRHSVAMGLSSGEVLEEFEIVHRVEGFQEFFSRIEKHQEAQGCGVAVAMEGYNGYARPLDSMVRQRGYSGMGDRFCVGISGRFAPENALLPIPIIAKYPLALISPGNDVIQNPRILHPHVPCHAAGIYHAQA